MKESTAMAFASPRSLVRLACLAMLAALAGCNPTWTKEGKPNDSSMPLPPGANAPQQAGGGDASATSAPKP